MFGNLRQIRTSQNPPRNGEVPRRGGGVGISPHMPHLEERSRPLRHRFALPPPRSGEDLSQI